MDIYINKNEQLSLSPIELNLNVTKFPSENFIFEEQSKAFGKYYI